MRFDLVDLRLFLRVAETTSITHGAAKANMALASASERLRGMEEELGAALLERGRRGVALTPAGRTLVHHAQLVLQQMEAMHAEMSEFVGGAKGHIRLLANTSALSEFLPEALNAFLADNTHIDIDIEENPSYRIVRLIAEGFADVGVVADIVDFGDLQTFPFAVDRLVVVMPRRHALAGARRLSFRDLLNQEFVGLSAMNALEQHLGQHAVRAGRPLKLRVRLGSFDAVCRMVENGVGIVVIPETAARRCRQTMAIRIARLSDPWALRRLHVCIRGLAGLPEHARRLVQHLSRYPRPRSGGGKVGAYDGSRHSQCSSASRRERDSGPRQPIHRLRRGAVREDLSHQGQGQSKVLDQQSLCDGPKIRRRQ